MPSKKAAVESADEALSETDAVAEAVVGEPVAAPHAPAAAPARYVAMRHLIRNGREYFPGEEVDMTPDRYYESNERLFAAHLADLLTSGAIQEG